jgi:hypothetical protein
MRPAVENVKALSDRWTQFMNVTRFVIYVTDAGVDSAL